MKLFLATFLGMVSISYAAHANQVKCVGAITAIQYDGEADEKSRSHKEVDLVRESQWGTMGSRGLLENFSFEVIEMGSDKAKLEIANSSTGNILVSSEVKQLSLGANLTIYTGKGMVSLNCKAN